MVPGKALILIDVQQAQLADVRGMDWTKVLDDLDPDSALARSIRRLVENMVDPSGVISAFSSFVE